MKGRDSDICELREQYFCNFQWRIFKNLIIVHDNFSSVDLFPFRVL